jgi:uncharacterized FAD-dependent dehydrogenase
MMDHKVDIRIYPSQLEDEDLIKGICARELDLSLEEITAIKIVKKSIDSRGRRPKYVLRIQVGTTQHPIQDINAPISYQLQRAAPTVVIVGAGPAGYFAALQCLEHGIKPVIYDRGKDVRERRRDLRAIQQFGTVNPDSNYCFGEGGAGTYSDGKLYTRANKRGNIAKVLQILVDHGATSDILVDAHPHIGSNKLPKIISAIHDTITLAGGEVHFNQRIEDFEIANHEIAACINQHGDRIVGDAYILATGHSARDIYELCDKRGVQIEFKPYAIGVRIEHPQSLIDEIQYNQRRREDNLPAASYKLVCQVGGRGVFSFCMCPGGLIVPAATAPNELVVNGMSLSKRDSPFANSGTVVSLDQNPYADDVFGGLRYQKELEQKMFNYGDGGQQAPAQRLTDFAEGKLSASLGDTSYIPGIYAAPMHELLPDWIYDHLSKAVKVFGQKMNGYYTSEAQVIGLESRTSAPLRILRDADKLNSPTMANLFPCGEGAGFAGGILSAALDGQRVSTKIAESLRIEIHE